MRSYGETRKKLDEAAAAVERSFEMMVEAGDDDASQVVALVSAQAALAVGYANLELAFQTSQLAVEVKRNTHLR